MMTLLLVVGLWSALSVGTALAVCAVLVGARRVEAAALARPRVPEAPTGSPRADAPLPVPVPRAHAEQLAPLSA